MKMVNAHFTCDMLVLSFENEILFKSFLTNPAKGYQGI